MSSSCVNIRDNVFMYSTSIYAMCTPVKFSLAGDFIYVYNQNTNDKSL
jgi:hypothetical protein